MFINNINPVLFSIGPFGIRYYGLVYALGFLIGYLFLRRSIIHKKLKITEEQLDIYLIWLIFGSIFMARFFEIFIYNAPYYLSHLSEIFQIWNGGLSFQGGFIGAILVTYFFSKRYKIHFYDIADLAVLPATLTLFFGKLANYTNSELYGRVTNVPWCVVFQKIDTYCRHPSQIYEALTILLLFGALLAYYLYYEKFKHKYVKGTIFWIFILEYSILRFLMTFLREEPLYLGLNVGQWISLGAIIISGLFLIKHRRQNPKVYK